MVKRNNRYYKKQQNKKQNNERHGEGDREKETRGISKQTKTKTKTEEPIHFFYKKNDNTTLFHDLEKHGFYNTQNYIPIYERYFKLTTHNWNSINLNEFHSIQSIHSHHDKTKELYRIYNKKNKLLNSFFKLSPIIDPVRYMCGKYNILNASEFTQLPVFQQDTPVQENPIQNTSVYREMTDTNNVAYIDALFYYLTSKLLHTYDFINATDFYGSFLSIKRDFKINIYDDLDYLEESKFFIENCGTLFTIEDDDTNKMLNFDTRKNKTRIEMIEDTNTCEDASHSNIVLSPNDDLELMDMVFVEDICDDNIRKEEIEEQGEQGQQGQQGRCEDMSIRELTDADFCLDTMLLSNKAKETDPDTIDNAIEQSHSAGTSSSNTTCSSRGSDTTDGNSQRTNKDSDDESDCESDDELECESDNESECMTESSTSTTTTESGNDTIEAKLPQFPVNIICIEQLENTLDSYIESYEISQLEWSSILIQVLMSLITYQKVFDFTHNDLHTNNIMYNHTEEDYIYYLLENKYYKVPTFGKIYKIIDFGRAIYKFNDNVICSNHYANGNDAHSQYNFGVYMDERKPLLEPNRSFDLCRLACSLYDTLFDIDDPDTQRYEKDTVEEIIDVWIRDDNDKNILYKSNGKERYPGFKLYKMIAREVHNHIPIKEIERPFFQKFVVSRKHINTKTKIINIDKIPSMVSSK